MTEWSTLFKLDLLSCLLYFEDVTKWAMSTWKLNQKLVLARTNSSFPSLFTNLWLELFLKGFNFKSWWHQYQYYWVDVLFTLVFRCKPVSICIISNITLPVNWHTNYCLRFIIDARLNTSTFWLEFGSWKFDILLASNNQDTIKSLFHQLMTLNNWNDFVFLNLLVQVCKYSIVIISPNEEILPLFTTVEVSLLKSKSQYGKSMSNIYLETLEETTINVYLFTYRHNLLNVHLPTRPKLCRMK